MHVAIYILMSAGDDVPLGAGETRGPRVSGGRFSRAKPKSHLDWAQYRAARLPGPADYPDRSFEGTSGGTFNESRSKTELGTYVPPPAPGRTAILDPAFAANKTLLFARGLTLCSPSRLQSGSSTQRGRSLVLESMAMCWRRLRRHQAWCEPVLVRVA